MRDYYIKENYYFDIDHLNQLRISGPGNHLFAGISFPRDVQVIIDDYYMVDDSLIVEISTNSKNIKINKPIVCDIRTVRSMTEGVSSEARFIDLINQKVSEVMPKRITKLEQQDTRRFCYLNFYLNEFEEEKYYGSCIEISRDFKSIFTKKSVTIRGDKNVNFKLQTRTNIKSLDKLEFQIFHRSILDKSYLNEFLVNLYYESERNIDFLLRGRRTSSYEYGTIFPRDWIESADLGNDDLTQEAVDYMYVQSLMNVSEEGEGWHEVAIGEYRAKLSDPSVVIDRKMIDIEPRYILGLRSVSSTFLTNELNQKILQKVASYIIKNAKEKELITFKQKKGEEGEYHKVGNWRDSEQAYPEQKSPLAPFDVNCIFYPQSLMLIKEHYDYFKIEDIDEIQQLIDKWSRNKDKFRLYHPDGIMGYSLALHGKKNKPLPTAHLDESYDMFYGNPSIEEVVSFAKKLVSPDFFYTPGGPILVDLDDEDFDTKQYHGKVIWPKQAAYCTAGLVRQIQRGFNESWDESIIELIRSSVTRTSEACFKGWQDIGYVPELYYYNKDEMKAKPYTAQEDYEGQMSKIQLWSSVGARRIIRDYIFCKSLQENM